MPLMSGSVQEVLDQRGPMQWSHALDLLLVVSEAIHFAHSHDVLHRDIKPGNILLDAAGRPLVADFGIAKLVDQTQGVSSTIELTTAFAAPERFRGDPASVRTDLYSLAATFVSLVTGDPPFPAMGHDTPEARILRVLDDEPVDLKGPVPDIPGGLAVAISSALAKDPEQRPSSVDDFRSSLMSSAGRQESSSWGDVTVALPTPARVTTHTPPIAALTPAAAPDVPTSEPSQPLAFLFGFLAVAAIAVVSWLILRDSPGADQVQTQATRSSTTTTSPTTPSPTTTTDPTTPPTTTTNPPAPDARFFEFASAVDLGFAPAWATELLGAPEISEDDGLGQLVSTYLGEETAAVVISSQDTITAWGLVTCAAEPGATVLDFELGVSPMSSTPVPEEVGYTLFPQGTGAFDAYFAHWWGGPSRADALRFQLAGSNYRCVGDTNHCATNVPDDYLGDSFHFGAFGEAPFPVDLDSCTINMVGRVRANLSSDDIPPDARTLLNRLDFAPDRLATG